VSRPERIVVLVRPRNPGNLGAAARVAESFDVVELRVVRPAASRDEVEAMRLAGVSRDLLAHAREFDSLADAVADCDAVAAATSTRGRDLEPVRLPELPKLVAELRPGRLALVFGPEKGG